MVVFAIKGQNGDESRNLQRFTEADAIHLKYRYAKHGVFNFFRDADELMPARVERNYIFRILEPFRFFPRVMNHVGVLYVHEKRKGLLATRLDGKAQGQ